MSGPIQPVAAGVSLDEMVVLIRRTWRSALVWAVAASVILVAIGIIRPRNYTARASFVAEQEKTRSLPAGIGALASQFGIGISGDGGRSPQFYQNLVSTSGLLLGLIDSLVEAAPGESVSVRRLFRGEPSNTRASTDRLLRRLRKQVAAQVDSRTGVVTITVASRTPSAAEGMAGLVIGSIKHFNVATRQLRARELRTFLENRVADALGGLHDAEDELRVFYQRNRRIGDSPNLIFEEGRMKRQVELRQELYTTLSRELESARIDEVNDTPTITVIDAPLASSRADGPGLVMLSAIGLVLGVAVRALRLLVTGR
jgi:uncharacterized protein involved in exopolysaccharide biosynthesis